MKMYFSLSYYILTLLYKLAICEQSEFVKLFHTSKIVPDVLKEAPENVLKITYENDVVGHAGNELTPLLAQNEPQLEWSADSDAFYTLIMCTPDAPDPQKPIWREFLRWQVVNVPGMAIGDGEVICPYLGPSPPKGLGKARYIFVIFKQPGVLTFDEPILNSSTIAGHINFSTMKFAEKYDLGAPVAGDFFVAEWDESVPALHKQLTYVFD